MNQTQLNKLINSTRPILITGETGTGKSQMAKSIFTQSHFAKEKFLTLHLASIKEELLESELYGHRRGAFTGSVENKIGYFKEVGKGTLFIDEVGELSLEAQKKLLFLLEEKKFTPIGDTQSITFEGRLIFATNRNLKTMVDQNKFREDLYFRLMNFNIVLSPLREQGSKVIELELTKFEEINNKKLSQNLKSFLLNHHWPGNFRELKNALDYVLLMSQETVLEIDLLPDWLLEQGGQKRIFKTNDNLFIDRFIGEDYGQSIEAFEKFYLREILNRNEGRINETARKIGISKSALIYKARKYQINTLELRANKTLERLAKVA